MKETDMKETGTPESRREILEELIGKSRVLRTEEKRNVVRGFSDEIIKKALESPNAADFYLKVFGKDIITTDMDTIPKDYVLLMELVNERARDKYDEEELRPEMQADGDNFLKLLKRRIRRFFRL